MAWRFWKTCPVTRIFILTAEGTSEHASVLYHHLHCRRVRQHEGVHRSTIEGRLVWWRD